MMKISKSHDIFNTSFTKKEGSMLTYDLEKRTGQPLYLLLYRAIREDILSGKLSGKLPSKRTLAQHLKLSTVTVENAYAQLIAEGFIESIEKKGYFVSEIPAIPAGNRTFTKENAAKTSDSSVFLDLQKNQPDPAVFPFSVWSKLMREVLSGEDREKLLGAADPCGVVELREAIAESLYRLRGLEVSPENILIGAGTDFLYNVLAQLLGRNSTCAVEDPGYSKIAEVYAANQITVTHIPVEKDGISTEKLQNSGANILHISPSHHFPTGNVTQTAKRKELLAWAMEKEDRYIIEDDYDSEFRITGRPLPAMKSIDLMGKVIYMNSYTKTIAPSIRISYMVLPESLMQRFREKLKFYSCTVPSFEQYTLARFIRGGYFERHLNRMKKHYREQRKELIRLILESPFAPYIKLIENDSGLHFSLKINTKKSDREVTSLAEKAGIRLSFLSGYAKLPADDYAHTVIINYSGIDMKKVPEALERLRAVFL